MISPKLKCPKIFLDSDEDDFMDGWRRQMEEALMKAYFESMFCSFHARGARQKVGRSSYTYASHRGYTGCGYAKGTANYERAKTEKAARPREEESRKSESVDSKSENRKGSQKAFLRREKKRRQKIAKKFEHPKHESVYKMICECEREEGTYIRALIGILRLGVLVLIKKLEFLGRNWYLFSKSKNVGGAIALECV